MGCTLCLVLLSVFSTNLSYTLENEMPSLERLVSMVTRETSVIIIHDEFIDTTSSLVKSLMYNQHTVTMYDYRLFYPFLGHHMNTVLEHVTLLKDYRTYLTFLVICQEECVESVMHKVAYLDKTVGQRSLLRHFSTWLIISSDSPQPLNITLDNIAWIKISREYPPAETDESCRRLFQCKVYNSLVQKSWNNSVIELYTLLWIPGRREWSRVIPLPMSHDHLYKETFPNTLRGLNGRQLLLAALEWRPYVQRQELNGMVYYTGAGVSVFDMLGRMFNFSFVIMEPDDMLWGQELKNGTYTGILGMIQKAEIDSCPVTYGMSSGRKKVMDFTHPITDSFYSAMFKRRTADMQSWLYFLSCFSWQVYLCATASLLWFVVLLVFIRQQKNLENSFVTLPDRRAVLNSFEIVIRIPLHQDILLTSKALSVRILIISWCLFCLVMTSVYTGNLVAFTTVDKYKPPFTTLEELALQNEYGIGVLEGGYAENMLMTSDDPLLRSVYERVTKSAKIKNYPGSTENTVKDAIQRILDEQYVLIAADSTVNIARTLTCDIMEMKEKMFPLHSSFPFPRYSPLLKLFNNQIMQMTERGVMKRLLKNWTQAPKNCDAPSNVPKFKFGNLKTVLASCSVCILVATLVLVIEILKKKYDQTH